MLPDDVAVPDEVLPEVPVDDVPDVPVVDAEPEPRAGPIMALVRTKEPPDTEFVLLAVELPLVPVELDADASPF